ncbi:hypothetical protein SAMN05518846_12930 [Brevibacillus centrosporus]|jgi:hypothetical protein|uniref:Uncharacterized protein n=1 Tax=Brevibacillus centrosporus TaxID=54910 RepID=A0A1I4EA76_9BACL|nr:hypothetical protein SAMN05518846_12930 [Brevibacillus centrosporus]
MLAQHVFLIILIMVGSLCSVLWSLQPEEQLRQTQEVRIHRAATVIFH